MKPPYEITSKILSLYGRISNRLGLCRGLRLARPQARLRRGNRIKTIHSSLAIEGNFLSMGQVTAILDGQRIAAPARDIVEVTNAVAAYDMLRDVTANSQQDFLRVHGVLMRGLVDVPGRYRSGNVGIARGEEIRHIAPGANMVPSLMGDLFGYLAECDDMRIIRSCVFHYEMEFIHPFDDGNGRMGRYWQTRILMDESPVFEFVPVEAAVRQHQAAYYQALADSDRSGKSTPFIEFMLARILESLDELLSQTRPGQADYSQRVEFGLNELEGWFDRKAYLQVCKGVSSATASRDLKQMVQDGVVEKAGVGRMTKYRKKVQA